ncbi:MAG: DEAD/DEAH box helicase [Deltaproteobacteria bacterium]|nr:DEAD/DEAH box helicase [Deltaproteobacteria bacterium]
MYSLRPYQKEAVEATLAHFRKSRRPAVIVLPTGAGKSLIIAELAKIARGRVLVLAHVKELIEQNFEKFSAYGCEAGIYSAGLNQKESNQKVIFGGIQSVARAPDSFFKDFSLLVVDECHRVSGDGSAQYSQVISKVASSNPEICILGLTATPYRLDCGWIYQYNHNGALRTEEPRVFKKCIYELTLGRMIDEKYLTPPVQIDAPVASYDFSSLMLQLGRQTFQLAEIEAILKDQSRVTPVIIQNIIELSRDRKGVILFTASVRHAGEILSLLPPGSSAMVLGDTPDTERDTIIKRFKAREIKYLVNVSVLTTGFDAPHVDLIAILRPTESVALYQQIVGRGLRLFEGKKDCLVLDYTGVPHDIYSPQIADRRPTSDSVPVKVSCPKCNHANDFWGVLGGDGELKEHFGKKCQGAVENPETGEIIPCGFRYRFRTCESCGTENDYSAESCRQCSTMFIDDGTKLKSAMSDREAHVMRPDSMTFELKVDKSGRERLEVRYYDLNAQHLSEVFFFSSPNDPKVFYYNFIRMHNRLPEKKLKVESIDDAIRQKDNFRLPLYIIARKQERFWKIREKLFL